MKNIEYICPICGSNVSFLMDNFCRNCYIEKIVFFEVPNVLHILICENCNSFNHKNKWEKYTTLEKALEIFTLEQVNVNRKIQHININVSDFKELSPYIYQVVIEGKSNFNSDIISKNKEIEIRIKKTSCITCSRKFGGYFEAILQIRAESRKISIKEINTINNFILELIKKYEQNGDQQSFISKYYEVKDGLDYRIGSTNVAKKIGKGLMNLFCSNIKESYTLIGVKDGKKTYRTTITIKIPKYKIGDIFYFEGNVIVIKNIYTKTIIMNLKTLSTKSININQLQNGVYLGNKSENVVPSIIISIERNNLLLLDTKKFDTFQIEKPSLFNISFGESINIFRCEYGNFLVI